ncbi:MAG: DMT family transporter [Anaerolineales bacterium]|jgi:drug/metabolite transporter (DMT)-like permease
MNKSIHTLSTSPFFNVMMFSAFWALQIFISKLGLNTGAKVLPFQVVISVVATITVASLLWSKTMASLQKLFKQRPILFWELFLANAIQAGLGAILNIIGIAWTNAINAGFLVKIATVTTVFFAWLILKESISGLKIAIVFLMLIGAYLLTTKGQTLLPRTGDLFILGACVCWSMGSVLVRKTLRTHAVDADVVTMQKPLASLPVFFVLIGISQFSPKLFGNLQPVLKCCTFSPDYFPYAIGSGICLALTWIFLFRTLSLASASYMTLMSMVTPVIVSILALTFLNERLILIQILGAGLIILSGVAIYFNEKVFS